MQSSGLVVILDVLLVALLVYRVLLFVRGTRAAPMLAGFTFLLILYWFSAKLSLVTLHWILANFLSSVILVIVVLFQDDLRRGLVKVGLLPGFARDTNQVREDSLRAVAKAVSELSNRKVGALIALERNVGLQEYSEQAVTVDGRVSHQVLTSIFQTSSPLHDGAVIISKDRLLSAGVVLPLTFNTKVSKSFGTRHRAAIGLSERTDALVVVVSEESGIISLVEEGKVTRDLTEKSLLNVLMRRFGSKPGESAKKPSNISQPSAPVVDEPTANIRGELN